MDINSEKYSKLIDQLLQNSGADELIVIARQNDNIRILHVSTTSISCLPSLTPFIVAKLKVEFPNLSDQN